MVQRQTGSLYPWSWSSDGKILVLMDQAMTVRRHQHRLSYWNTVDGRRSQVETAATGKVSMRLIRRFRPMGDGWHMHLDESGKAEIYVRPFPEVDTGKWQVSTSGGWNPLWSPDGRELFYRNGDSVMAVAVQTEPTFKAGKPKLLFRGAYFLVADHLGHQPGRQAVPDDKATRIDGCSTRSGWPAQNQHRPELV